MSRCNLLSVRLCVLILCSGAPLQLLHGQDTDNAQEPAVAAPQAPSRSIEQITVIGERTLSSMRNTIDRIEEDMYRAFNELNNSDDLDIFCVSETRTTSHIIQRNCEPVFLSKLKREIAQSALPLIRDAFTEDGIDLVRLEQGLNTIESEKNLQFQASAKYAELSAEILRITQENPAYLEALLQIGQLKAEYAAARKLKFGTND